MFPSDRPQLHSNVLLGVGIALVAFGYLASFSMIGLTSVALVPVPVTGAAILVRSRWRVGSALFVWGCWFFGLYDIALT